MKAVVIGGGFAGLAAGHRLHTAGWQVTLLERESRVGGRAHTSSKSGYLIEHGATQISTGYRAYLSLAESLGMRVQIIEASNVICLTRGGRLYEIDGRRPLLAAFSGALGLRSKLLMCRAITDFLALKPPLNVLDVSASYQYDTESALEYSERRLNREIYDVLVDPMIRAYTLNRADQVSAVEWFSCLRNLAGEKMLTLRGGIQRMPEALAAKLDVRLNCVAAAVRSTAGGVQIDYHDSGGMSQVLEADACVIGTQLPDAAMLAPELKPWIGELASALRYNRSVLVHLGFHKRTHSGAIGVLVGTKEHPQIGLVWLEHNKLPDSVPSKDHSLITVYFEESGIDTVTPDTDEHFTQIALAFVTKLFPELTGELELSELSRWQRAIPNPSPGSYRAINKMKDAFDASSPIQIAGDYFTCTGQNSAIHWGHAAADKLIATAARSSGLPVPSSSRQPVLSGSR